MTQKLIPKPLSFTETEGLFTLSKSVRVEGAGMFRTAKAQLEKYIAQMVERDPDAKDDAVGVVEFLESEGMHKEGYELVVTADKITITASTDKGAFYGVVTLAQYAGLLVVKGRVKVPCCRIKDEPRFSWRGWMIDESRHFFGKEEIKRYLDIMAYNKLNIFHWHLTDDQGWRIDIKAYPKLKSVASFRNDTTVGGWKSSKKRGEPHSGCYSQEDIKEVVAYAKALNIDIVPEIGMPAHSRAAMAAYPFLGCREIQSIVPWYFGTPKGVQGSKEDQLRIACAGKESTYEFIFRVIDEVCELFPFGYFHIGGDEAPKAEWKKCPHCQETIAQNGLKDEEALQSYFNNRIGEYLETKGKKIIGWNEILKGEGLSSDTIAQHWEPGKRGIGKTAEWVAKGNKIIMSRHNACYFDMAYAMYPLANTYNFEPVQPFLPEGAEKHILGCEGHIWTEFIENREKLDVQSFPRMLALAEVCWVKAGEKDYKEFLARWELQKTTYKALGINFAEQKVFQPFLLKRPIDLLRWDLCDQHFEVRKNAKLKNKK